MKPEAKRLFVGTFLSPAQQQNLGELEKHTEKLKHSWQLRVRWVKAVKLHLTWLFLGDNDAKNIPEIASLLKPIAAASKSFQLSYDQVELWPSARRPCLLVLTPKVIPDEVVKVATLVSNKVGQFQEKKEDRAYRPHITLARLQMEHQVRSAKIEIPEWLSNNKLWPIVHNIDNISLIESHLGSEGDQYEILSSFRFP